jgi:DNA (cytosine-5)-methyltransferase 1
MVTFTDIFCGAGGSSIGLAETGMELRLAANHWDRAIETHAANFPHAEHVCADISNYEMRRLPRTDVLWASPICTEASPAGGTSGYRRPARSKAGQLDLMHQADTVAELEEFGHVPKDAMVRTRATFLDVIRAAEVHRYQAVIVENVPDVIDRWELFDWWLAGMERLGYRWQLVSVSSAHIHGPGNPPAPQWRDRLYIVFTRTGLPLPDVTPRPMSLCEHCGIDVPGVQTWCPAARGRALRHGRYRRDPASNYGQYWYTCRQRVEPYVAPAASAIDWTDLGTRIGDLAEPLAPATLARIRIGLDRYGPAFTLAAAGNTHERHPGTRTWPIQHPLPTQTGTAQHAITTATETAVEAAFVVNSNHDDTRVYPAGGRPLTTRTGKIGDAVCVPPLLVPCGGTYNTAATPAGEPMRTGTAREMELLVTPEPFVAVLRRNATADSIRNPLATLAAQGGHHALIIPYYRTGIARTADAPLDTVTVKDRFGLTTPPVPPAMDGIAVTDCLYRMLDPRESLTAQRFPMSYVVHGNRGERTMQAGNAVSANVAHWIGRQITAAISATPVRQGDT